MSRLRELGYKKNRTTLENAYAQYIEKVHEAESDLFKEVLGFAQKKMSSALFDSDECHLACDYAQEVAIGVWQKLPSFTGNPSAFYAWVNRICWIKGKDAHRHIKKENEGRIPLQIESTEGFDFLEDNPEIYVEIKHHTIRKLPDFIQGVDRYICDLIRDGLDYKQIGDALNMTESAIKKHVQRMKEKVEKESAKSKED